MSMEEEDMPKTHRRTVFPSEGDNGSETYQLSPMEIKNIQLQATSAAENKQGENLLNSKSLLAGFVDFTTSHGITHIYKSKGIVKKMIWTILSVISLVALCLHLGYMVTGYIGFAVITTIEVVEERAMDFPAVTICNNNGVKESTLPAMMRQIIDDKKNGLLNGTDSVRSNAQIYQRLSEEISLLNQTQQEALGYSYSELIIYCTFRGDNCDQSKFWRFFHSVYGNCYTFNTDKVGENTIEQSNLAGAGYGLTLIVNIAQYDYLSYLAEDAGVRIAIHDQTAMPFPEHNGFSASPGQVSNLAVKRIRNSRLDGKYGNCTRLTMNSENMYFSPYNVSYTQWACLRTCYQKQLVKECGCFDPTLPYDYDTDVFSSLTRTQDPCRVTNSTDVICSTRITSNFADRTLKCSHCYQPCEEVTFESSLSTSSFPADSYVDNFMEVLNLSNPNLITRLVNNYGEQNLHQAVKANFLKLNVFYQEMTYVTYEQVASYDDFQFVSDLGGAYGLWIGWSVLTFFELIELVFDFIQYLCFRSKSNQ